VTGNPCGVLKLGFEGDEALMDKEFRDGTVNGVALGLCRGTAPPCPYATPSTMRSLYLRMKRLWTPAHAPIALLLLTLPLTLYASIWPEITRVAVAWLVLDIAVFYAVFLWARTERRLRLGAFLLVMAGVALALVAPFGVDWIEDAKGFLNFSPIYTAIPRLIDERIHPNILAGALAAVLPLAVSLMFPPGTEDRGSPILRRLLSVVCGLASAVMLAVLVLTKSRGAWLGTAVGLGIVLIYRWPRLRWPALALVALLLIAGLIIGPARVAQALAAAPVVGGWEGRLELWSRALEAVADYPFTGIGMGTFDHVIPLRYPYVLLAGAELAIPHAHNLFLQVAVDLGLPGLIAFVALLGLVLAAAVRSARAWAGDQALALQVTGLAAGLVAVLVHGLLDAASWGSKPAVFIWALMGLIMAHQAVSLQRRTPSPAAWERGQGVKANHA